VFLAPYACPVHPSIAKVIKLLLFCRISRIS